MGRAGDGGLGAGLSHNSFGDGSLVLRKVHRVRCGAPSFEFFPPDSNGRLF